MHDLPLTVHPPKKKRFVTAIVYFSLVAFDGRFYLGIGDGPGEIAFHVGFNIQEIQLQTVERIALRLHMMFDQVGKAGILATGFDVSGTFRIQKMITKRRAVSLLPTDCNGVDDGDQLCCIVLLCLHLLYIKR